MKIKSTIIIILLLTSLVFAQPEKMVSVPESQLTEQQKVALHKNDPIVTPEEVP